MEGNTQRARTFEALFDGDEIDGKRYALGDKVEGLDAPTAAYLIETGRIAEVDGESSESSDADRHTAAAQAAFDAGNIPSEFIDPDKPADAADRLISGAELAKLAEAEGVTLSGSTKAAKVVSFMAARSANADG